MDVQHSSYEHCAELCQNHDNGKEFFVTNSIFELSVIKLARPEGHRFVILDNVRSHLVARGIAVNVKGFIVVRISKEAILYHKCFHAFEGKIHCRYPTKCFLSRFTGEGCKNVCMLGPHVLVMIDSTKEACKRFLGFCICRIPLISLHHSFKSVCFSQYPSQSVSWMAHLHLSGFTLKPLASS